MKHRNNKQADLDEGIKDTVDEALSRALERNIEDLAWTDPGDTKAIAKINEQIAKDEREALKKFTAL